MEASRDASSRDRGEGTRLLFLADPHFHDRGDRDEIVGQVEDYVREYAVDEFVSGGDVGGRDDIDALLSVDAPMRRGVGGNHDAPYEEEVAADGGDLQYGEEIVWERDGYRIGMVHDPRDMQLRATRDTFVEEPPDDIYEIILHGHSHYPDSRVVAVNDGYRREDPLAISGGGFPNYNVIDALPGRSMHLIELRENDVIVQHRDFDTGDLVEEVQYRFEPGDGFQELARWTDWDGDRFVQA